MTGVLIRIKDGYELEGNSATIGKDISGVSHNFDRSQGHVEVPVEIALFVEKERPQRFEVVDRGMAELIMALCGDKLPPPSPKEEPKADVTLKKIKGMTKDEMNDWAAKRDYDINASDNKPKMIKELVCQIEKRTGKKVE